MKIADIDHSNNRIKHTKLVFFFNFINQFPLSYNSLKISGLFSLFYTINSPCNQSDGCPAG